MVGFVERGEKSRAHSLEVAKSLLSALVAAPLDWSEDVVDEGAWRCRPTTKVYLRRSGLGQGAGVDQGKALKTYGDVREWRIDLGERIWGEVTEVRGDGLEVYEKFETSTLGPFSFPFSQQLVTGTTRGSREFRAAQDPRGEEEAEPRASGRTNKRSERTAEFKCGDVRMVQWDGRSGELAGVAGHQQITGMAAKWEGEFTASPRHPMVATQHLHAEPSSDREAQPGPSGVASLDLIGHTVLDYDEESLEEREVQEKHRSRRREVEWWQKENILG
ncbi:hypothetical protein NDU88_000232 [Pleurodeles waltl]|uniref:Uncharacterized protein n=1 Tax=Pleurodeles waltl TaxID=8319 RepID=A0AAV7S6Z2_PLEWA|nr:hypothetical protein NDU88_000232 [Pleurodeles waltl]